MEGQILAFLWIVAKIIFILILLFVLVAYITTGERKIIGYIQRRIGPNRVGMRGLLQPIADTVKLFLKEIILPSKANPVLFLLAPMLAIAPALAAWAVIPMDKGWVLSNVNAGVLYLFAATSLGVYGVLLGGWSSNSKYAFLGSLRCAAQVISYEIAMGFVFAGVLLASGSLNLTEIVMKQSGGIWHWYWLPLLPLFIVYWICALAETNRSPFDVAEGESELVAGFQVEYSGMAFALFFLAEYANMFLISAVVALLFLGGWMSPFQGIPGLQAMFAWVPGIIWVLIKMAFFMFCYLWIRATFPRYRYDQIMYLGWKVLIPVTLVWLVVVAIGVQCHVYWFH